MSVKPDYSKLLATLANSRTLKPNDSAYQAIVGLIRAVQLFSTDIQGQVTGLADALTQISTNTGNISLLSAAHYLTSQAESVLSGEVNLGALASGILAQTVSGSVSTPIVATIGSGLSYVGTTLSATGGGSGGPLWPLTPPDDSLFTWINQGTATNTTIANNWVKITAIKATGDSIKIRKQAVPSAPYTKTIAFFPTMRGAVNTNDYCGICLRESSSGKLFVATLASTGVIGIYEYTNPTTFSGTTIVNQVQAVRPGLVWIQFVDDNTNRITNISYDGYTWIPIDTRARTNYITPDEIGYMTNSGNNVTDVSITVAHWA